MRIHAKDSFVSRRILAIRPGGLGDCILSFPAIESLRGRSAYLEVWVPRAVVPLVRFADQVRAISATGLDMFGIPGVPGDRALIEALREFDTIVSWYGTKRDDLRRAADALELPIEFHAALPPEGPGKHAVDFFSAQLGAPAGAIPRISLEGIEPRDFVAIHPFSGSPRKNWPLERFKEAAHRLNYAVEWCVSPEQTSQIAAPGRVLAVDDLREVGRWLASARVYLGNDSGLTHLAAAMGTTPVVALFGASDPSVWAPRGPRVEVVEAASMGEISVDSVTAAVRRYLS